MKTKRLFLATVLVALAALALPTAAFANFAIHGNYVQDTDACAGCHRAHTSVATITWTDGLGTSTHRRCSSPRRREMWQFCYACHDATSQGADTNVQQGIYEGTLYGTSGGILNGGGFDSLDQSATSPRPTCTRVRRGAPTVAATSARRRRSRPTAATPAKAPTPSWSSTGNSIKMDCATLPRSSRQRELPHPEGPGQRQLRRWLHSDGQSGRS